MSATESPLDQIGKADTGLLEALFDNTLKFILVGRSQRTGTSDRATPPIAPFTVLELLTGRNVVGFLGPF